MCLEDFLIEFLVPKGTCNKRARRIRNIVKQQVQEKKLNAETSYGNERLGKNS